MAESYFLGVDLGGTQMRMAAVTPRGTLASEVLAVRTGAAFAPDDLRREVRQLAEQVARRMNGQALAGLGFGTAGVVTDGPLTQSPHLPRIEGTNVAEIVSDAMGCPVTVENDARCFTLAEARYGAGRGATDVCGLVLGTGVGCGVMVGGRLHRGATAQAGEVYHIQLRGQSVEYFVAGAGVVRGYAAAGGRPGPDLDAAQVADRARANDAAAVAAWRSFGEDLAFLCEAVIGLLDPEVIVIGGSLARAGDLFKPVLLARLDKHATRIAEAELGPAAGVIGAAALNIASV
jgi:predicted NBD/HSP70 family sugar kinase